MAMVTRCPDCATAFRVTAEQLQAHSGQVRCGRCESVFDAFPTLTAMPDTLPVRRIEGPADEPATGAIAQGADPRTAAEPPRSAWIPADRGGGDDALPSAVAAEPTPTAGDGTADPPPMPPGAVHAPGDPVAGLPPPPHETAYMPDEPTPAPARPALGARVPQRGAAAAPSLTDYSVPPLPASRSSGRLRWWFGLAVIAAAGAGLWWMAGDQVGAWLLALRVDETVTPAVSGWPGGYLAGLLGTAGLLALWLAFRRQRRRAAALAGLASGAYRPARRRTGLWVLAGVALAAALLAQSAYVWRSELAAGYPALRPALEAGCRALGCEIGLPRRAEALFIDSSDLEAIDDARPGLVRLSATIRNRGNVTLAYPALELTLTDARDRTLARRVFLPAQYLGAADARAGIAPGAEFSVRLTLDTTDLKPAGYRLFLFYP